MHTIQMAEPTLALAEQLAQHFHCTPNEVLRRGLILLEFLLEQQTQGHQISIAEQQIIRRLVLTHYSDGYINVHEDRIVL